MNILPFPALPLALPPPAAPHDRAIWLRADVVSHEECFTSVEPFEGRAQWSESARDWLDGRGMSIRQDFDSELVVLSWIELAERAKDAPTHETDVTAHVYYWDDEWRLATGRVGYFALCHVRHSPTGIELEEACEGPFETQIAALEVLTALLARLTSGEKARVAA